MEFKMKLSEENQGGWGQRKGRKFEKTDIILMRLGWAYLQTEETMAQLSNWPRSEISFLCFHWCCGMFYSVVPELSTALSSFPLSTPKPPRRISSSWAFVSPVRFYFVFALKSIFAVAILNHALLTRLLPSFHLSQWMTRVVIINLTSNGVILFNIDRLEKWNFWRLFFFLKHLISILNDFLIHLMEFVRFGFK